MSKYNPLKITSLTSAFTLIELSIVLVIIGLLAGGALVGRSLLRQSEVATIMADAQKYINATKAFKEKYAALPGDMASATSYWGAAGGTVGTNYSTDCYTFGSATSPATCNGDGDSTVEVINEYAYESLRMWQHLASAGFITGTYDGIGVASINDHVIGKNCPIAKITNGGFGLSWRGILSGDTLFFDGSYGHTFIMGGQASGGSPLNPALTGGEAQSVDNKFDDGKPALGIVRSFKNGALSYVSTCASSTTSTAVYNTAKTFTCSLIVITGL